MSGDDRLSKTVVSGFWDAPNWGEQFLEFGRAVSLASIELDDAVRLVVSSCCRVHGAVRRRGSSAVPLSALWRAARR